MGFLLPFRMPTKTRMTIDKNIFYHLKIYLLSKTLVTFQRSLCEFLLESTRMSMKLSNYLGSWVATYLGDLQPTYIGVIIYLLSNMDILVGSGPNFFVSNDLSHRMDETSRPHSSQKRWAKTCQQNRSNAVTPIYFGIQTFYNQKKSSTIS